jgi:HlyD family secretion protein
LKLVLELEHGFLPEEVLQAKSEIHEAEAQREQLKAEFERSERLAAGNALAARDYDIAKSAFLGMSHKVDRLRIAHQLLLKGPRQERIDLARAEVQQARAHLKKAKWRLDNCSIRAPIAGTVLRKNAEEGNIVNPIAFNGSYSLCELADLSDLEVELCVQEREISRVFYDQHCKIRTDAFPKRMYDGTVSRLMPVADRAKGTITIRVKVTVPPDEGGVYLKPEMGAIVSFMSSGEVSPQK